MTNSLKAWESMKGFLDVFGGTADWQSSKGQVRRIKNAKFKMSKLPDAVSILAFLIFNLLILNWLSAA